MIGEPQPFRCNCPRGTTCEWVYYYGGTTLQALTANQQARQKALGRNHKQA